MAPCRGRSRQGASEEAATGAGSAHPRGSRAGPAPRPAPQRPSGIGHRAKLQCAGTAPPRKRRRKPKGAHVAAHGHMAGGRQREARRPGRLTRACTPTHLATHAGMPGLSHPVFLLHGTAHLPVTFTTWSRRGRAPESGHIQGPEMATAQPRVVS